MIYARGVVVFCSAQLVRSLIGEKVSLNGLGLRHYVELAAEGDDIVRSLWCRDLGRLGLLRLAHLAGLVGDGFVAGGSYRLLLGLREAGDMGGG